MKWIKSTERVPNHNNKVLVFDGTDFYMGIYHRDPERFILEHHRPYELELADIVFWAETTFPE